MRRIRDYAIALIFLFLGGIIILSGVNSITPVKTNATVIVKPPGGGLGSGVMLDNGYILTAGHVAKDITKEKPAKIVAQDGEEFTATVVFVDAVHDVALLKPEANHVPQRHLVCVAPFTGQRVQIVGNPLGLKFVHSWGRVAQPMLEAVKGFADLGKDTQSKFLMDATVLPGNSGGPIYNHRGDVIGVLIELIEPQITFGDASYSGFSIGLRSDVICKSLEAHIHTETRA